MSIKLAILFATLAYVNADHLESPLQVPFYTTTPATYGGYGASTPALSYAAHPALAYRHNYVPTLPYGHILGYSGYGHSSIAPLTTFPAARGYGYANHVSHDSAYGHYAY